MGDTYALVEGGSLYDLVTMAYKFKSGNAKPGWLGENVRLLSSDKQYIIYAWSQNWQSQKVESMEFYKAGDEKNKLRLQRFVHLLGGGITRERSRSLEYLMEDRYDIKLPGSEWNIENTDLTLKIPEACCINNGIDATIAKNRAKLAKSIRHLHKTKHR